MVAVSDAEGVTELCGVGASLSEHTGTTPARFVERVRVEAARNMLENTTTPIETVAARSGFGSDETMRRAFIRVLGVGPADYRERFRKTELLEEIH